MSYWSSPLLLSRGTAVFPFHFFGDAQGLHSVLYFLDNKRRGQKAHCRGHSKETTSHRLCWWKHARLTNLRQLQKEILLSKNVGG